MATALYILLALGSFACLISLIVYSILLFKGNSVILTSMSGENWNWKHVIFLVLAAIGLFVCIVRGFQTLLFWLPETWGSNISYTIGSIVVVVFLAVLQNFPRYSIVYNGRRDVMKAIGLSIRLVNRECIEKIKTEITDRAEYLENELDPMGRRLRNEYESLYINEELFGLAQSIADDVD